MTQPRRRRWVARGVAWLLVIVVTGAATVAAESCAQTGDAAPKVVTLMASKTNPRTDAWVVSPNCTIETIPCDVRREDISLNISARGIERVVSVPASVRTLTENPLSQGVDFSKATWMVDAKIMDTSIGSNPGGVLVPPNLEAFSISNDLALTSLDNVKFPSTLRQLSFTNTPNLKTLKTAILPNATLPLRLSELVVATSKVTAADFQYLPKALERLTITGSPIGGLERVFLPSALKMFVCIQCGISAVRGVKWPPSIKSIMLSDDVTGFEVRQSDVSILAQLDEFAVTPTQTSCTGSGVLKEVKKMMLCVISDNEFESRYSASSPANGPRGDTLAASNSTGTSSKGSRGNEEDPSTDVTAGNDSSGSSSPLVIVVLGCALAVSAVATLYYTRVARKKRQENAVTEIATSNRQQPSEARIAASTVDFRNDKELVRHRIDHIQVGKQIARSGYTVVYHGTCEGRAVAIKQMLPDAWLNDSVATYFLDEIRMYARLDHPKIVEFVGVSWTSLHELSVITAFMAGGDLHAVVHKYPESTGREWSRPWSPSNLRSKTLIAMDVAEAIVYLHSFNSPIIHRNLKAKNVLLDPVGNAKLSDFGISRTVSTEETMTSEIGTAAWIAPEVLRGGRYSEKADIYSLGALLVELDRCRHPYVDEPMLLHGRSAGHVGVPSGNKSHVAHKDTQIAVLVSTGKLKPSPSRECPEAVSEVIKRCVRFEASHRPTAMEVFYALRQIQKAQASAASA